MAAADGASAMVAVVLAGDRSEQDPLLQHAGKPGKAMIEIGGRAMVLRVLDALRASASVDSLVLSGPRREHLESLEELRSLIDSGAVAWHAPGPSPSASAHAVLESLPSDRAVMLTTTDHPLLSAALVDEFCQRSQALGADVVVGLAPYELVAQAFPELKKTVLRFRDGNYCGCNLFAFTSARGRQVAERWREVEAERKTPRKVISLLGIWSVLAYRLGWLSLDAALERLSRRFGLRLAVVVLEHPEAAVDVDSAADHLALEQRLA